MSVIFGTVVAFQANLTTKHSNAGAFMSRCARARSPSRARARGPGAALVLVLIRFLTSSPLAAAATDERVLDFRSDIAVKGDGSLVVTETLSVRSGDRVQAGRLSRPAPDRAELRSAAPPTRRSDARRHPRRRARDLPQRRSAGQAPGLPRAFRCVAGPGRPSLHNELPGDRGDRAPGRSGAADLAGDRQRLERAHRQGRGHDSLARQRRGPDHQRRVFCRRCTR